MSALDGISIKVRNYKCFGNEEQGFDNICPINVIIGKNNTGKSTLLEIVKYAVNPDPSIGSLGHKGRAPEVFQTQPLDEQTLRKVFREDTKGGVISGNHWEFGKRWIGKPVRFKIENGKHTFIEVTPPFDIQRKGEFQDNLASHIISPLRGKVFRHLRAERNVRPEDDTSDTKLLEDGTGATNLVQHFINTWGLDRDLVERTLLEALNNIYRSDSSFERILTQRLQHRSAQWEVFLDEPNKGRIPLSHTGSGFKTVLLVLVILYLVPRIENKKVEDYVFAFEELENNLHPALQRRLLLFIRNFVMENGCTLFLTTHSSVVIDLFSRDDKAQIIHVTHDGEKALARPVHTYIDNKGIVDDLDVRASDLLQANCVVWVEGPSDRLYFNRWVEIWTEGKLKEGIHYQCVFYGGRLLSHLSAESPEENAEHGISIFSVNRNAICLMDSDKSDNKMEVSASKKRISEEISLLGGVAWVTHGREVENYLPTEALEQYYNKKGLAQLKPFEDIADYLDREGGGGVGKRFEKKKVEFAASISQLLTKANLSPIHDIKDKLEIIFQKIRTWNEIK